MTYCIVANMKSDCHHFSRGAKMYVLPPQWGDGFKSVVVIGRHKVDKRLVRMVIDSKNLCIPIVKVIYKPDVIRLIGLDTWSSKEEALKFLSILEERNEKQPNP